VNPIYLDYNATTPTDPAVVEAMEPFLRGQFGNPSRGHEYGAPAREAIERARGQVAQLVGAQASEIVFTGSGSEASNLALKGLVLGALTGSASEEPHIVTSAIEHPATLETCRFLQRLGCDVTTVPVDRYGVVELEALEAALGRRMLVVSVMHANNEVGTLEPIRQIANLARERGALLHTDAAQSIGKIGVDVGSWAWICSRSPTMNSTPPRGLGPYTCATAWRRLEPLIHGGGQEHGKRSGTENVPYVVGLGAACEIARRSLPDATDRLAALSERLWCGLQTALGARVVLNGHPRHRLPNTLNASFVGAVGAELLAHVPEIAASTGSACHEGDVAPSPVLEAMGVPPELGRAAIRLSVGRFTTEPEVERAAELLARRAAMVTDARR
jgi:cysteine desulfurase